MPSHSLSMPARRNRLGVRALCLAGALACSGISASTSRAQAPAAIDTAALPAGLRERAEKVGSGEWAVAAVLTMPAASAPVPAIVLMHGSGPGTRDGEIGPNRVYREMAWALAARGVAVLRYDKRSTAHQARFQARGRAPTMDEEHVDDAVAAARLLQRTPGVDPHRVYVLGLSQSTAVAADVAARVASAGEAPVAGLVLVSASARRPAEMILDQTEYGARVARQSGDSARLREALWAHGEAERMRRAELPDSVLALGMPLAYWRAMDPRRTWAETARFLEAGGRVLVVSGARDFQTTESDHAGWQRALARYPAASFRRYPALNHLMQPGVGKMTPAEFEQPMRVSPDFLDDVARWIGQTDLEKNDRGRR